MFKIEFATDNASFEEGGADEVADILANVAGLVREGYTSGPLTDANGNSIGRWQLDLPQVEETLETK